MRRSRSWFGVLAVMGVLSWTSAVWAQQAFYTFTSGPPPGDGFVWDFDNPPSGLNDLPDGDTFLAPDDLGNVNNFENFSGNTTFFDDSYQAVGNGSLIVQEAWWGNPHEEGIGIVDVSFINTPTGQVSSVSFAFAWAFAGQKADDFLDLEVYDSEFDSAFLSFDLNDSFDAGLAFGGVNGWEGSISFDLADVQFENDEVDEIAGFSIDLFPILTLGGTSEFAIDNLSIDGLSNVFPSINNGTDATGAIFLNTSLVGTGTVTGSQEVTNDGSEATPFSTRIEPGGDLGDPGQESGRPIDAGESLFTGTIATLDRSLPSGTYESILTIINDSNPTDPDDSVTRRVRLHDPPQLKANNSSVVKVHLGDQISLANAAAGPHAGAQRAGVTVDNRAATGPFTVSGLEVDDDVLPADNATATVSFDPFGQLSGIHNGTFTADLHMTSGSGSGLGNAEPVPLVVWDLEFSLPDTLTDSVQVSTSESFGPSKVSVNTAQTAATLIDGTSSSNQNVNMIIGATPPPLGPRPSLATWST